MKLDPRIPLGWMFTLCGLLLTFLGYSTSGNTELYGRSLGINVNLWWGLVLAIFGLSMLVAGYRALKSLEKESGGPR